MFDLAGVGFCRHFVHAENLFEKGSENVPFRSDPADEVLALWRQVDSMILSDLDEAVVLERSKLKGDRGP